MCQDFSGLNLFLLENTGTVLLHLAHLQLSRFLMTQMGMSGREGGEGTGLTLQVSRARERPIHLS